MAFMLKMFDSHHDCVGFFRFFCVVFFLKLVFAFPTYCRVSTGPSYLRGWSHIWEGTHCFQVSPPQVFAVQVSPSLCGEGILRRAPKFQCVLITNTGVIEASPPVRIHILTPFSHVTIFSSV